MANLTDFKTPTGQSGNLLNPRDWIALILGGFVLLATFGIAQNVSKAVTNRFPIIDTQIEKPWTNPPVVMKQSTEIVI